MCRQLPRVLDTQGLLAVGVLLSGILGVKPEWGPVCVTLGPAYLMRLPYITTTPLDIQTVISSRLVHTARCSCWHGIITKTTAEALSAFLNTLGLVILGPADLSAKKLCRS